MTARALQPRHVMLMTLLAGAAWLALFADKSPKQEVAQAISRPGTTSAAQTATAQSAVPRPTSSAPALTTWIPRTAAPAAPASAARRDLFASRNWTPAPAPVAPTAPPPPVAPALPFTFIGKKLDTGVWEVYAAKGDQTLVLREGQTVDGDWRIDRIAPPTMSLTFLPLGQAQSLPIGDDR